MTIEVRHKNHLYKLHFISSIFSLLHFIFLPSPLSFFLPHHFHSSSFPYNYLSFLLVICLNTIISILTIYFFLSCTQFMIGDILLKRSSFVSRARTSVSRGVQSQSLCSLTMQQIETLLHDNDVSPGFGRLLDRTRT